MPSLKPRRILRIYSLIIHILGLTSFALSFKYLFSLSNKLTNSFGGPFQQLTNLCMNSM